ncbi:TPM domain-containing protein [Thermaurantiacus sp.]
MQVSPAEHDRIAKAIAAAEARTSGEVACVLDRERYVYLEWVFGLAALIAFALPFLLALAGFGPTAWRNLAAPSWSGAALAERHIIELYVAAQVLIFILAAVLLWNSPLAQRLAPSGLRRARVHELALRQFLARGIHLTTGRTGVLIYASLHDRMTEIVADEGIYAKVDPEVWAEADAALLSGLARGDIAAGFEAAIARVGEVLAQHFPPAPRNPDELPNRLIEL